MSVTEGETFFDKVKQTEAADRKRKNALILSAEESTELGEEQGIYVRNCGIL